MNNAPPSGARRESDLVGAFVQMADTLVDDYDVPEVLHQLATHCVNLIGISAAGLLLSDQRGSLQLVASSNERTRLLELFQLQADEGPCIESFRTGDTVTAADLSTTTDRWPVFTPQALEQGFLAVHAVPLRLRGNVIGTLNLFNQRPGALSAEDAKVARALADIATIGILQERTIRHGEVLTEQLQGALNSRITIEQAKGLLAHAGGLDMEQAFQALRRFARAQHTGLSDIAHRLASGQLPPGSVLKPGRVDST
ncbi:transcriptional regulator [Nocardiopsis terrae]|uniref:GAF domain-containing protein n=1 Tax=Nocardiopsis terrae TaxID=372655 RepID=A0ABR9HEQ3_9ACTN|nr:GAF and ANTAR domain-containing protein [Nocardiopsis terrae]MBE1457506.1 GAF domain-containing protein [Nocardiopsis terrae]GHC85758.1 transcriptional regulator [Nocardiopsis terrae]